MPPDHQRHSFRHPQGGSLPPLTKSHTVQVMLNNYSTRRAPWVKRLLPTSAPGFTGVEPAAQHLALTHASGMRFTFLVS